MMLSRRSFLASTAAAGVALRLPSRAAAQPVRKRLIVDAQIHMWKASTPERPLVAGARPQLPEPMTIERAVSMCLPARRGARRDEGWRARISTS